MRATFWPGRLKEFTAIIMVVLTLSACTGSPASGDRPSIWGATTPASTTAIKRASGANLPTMTSATPDALIATPTGTPHEGVVTDIYRYVVPLDRLISGKEPTSPKGPPPFGFFLDPNPKTFRQGMETSVSLGRSTRIAKEQRGRLVPALRTSWLLDST